MVYKCLKCGYVSEQGGNCPTCDVPMEESKEEESSVAPESVAPESEKTSE